MPVYLAEQAGLYGLPLMTFSEYLGGGYVRADRNGDIRSDDELTLFVEAEILPGGRIDRYEHFRPPCV